MFKYRYNNLWFGMISLICVGSQFLGVVPAFGIWFLVLGTLSYKDFKQAVFHLDYDVAIVEINSAGNENLVTDYGNIKKSSVINYDERVNGLIVIRYKNMFNNYQFVVYSETRDS